ncbi:MAG TPA: DUF4836 family protein, partial [Flavipsychrobacter sp.]|nr:DUF4836 family protein [Flavipsychrobacter sp.]
MKRILSGALLLSCLLIFLGSCKKAADNAKHIPQDATAVFSVDLASIGKKLAWDILFGSDIFKEMTKSAGKDSSGMKDLQNAGIDFMNTFYSYTATDKRYAGEQRFAALIPLSDKGKWEAYVKKTWPAAKLKTVGDRTEAMLNESVYGGWDGDLLIMMNTVTKEQALSADGNYVPPVTDEIQTAAEMENAFKLEEKNSIAAHKHFSKLVKEGHDISLFVNYENILNSYGASMMGGLAPTAEMIRDAAFTSGFDFEKGAIKGDMKYYVSNELKAVSKDLMSGNPDKEMIQRLPASEMNLLATTAISPGALKTLLDRFNMLGFINIGLSEQGLTADDLFESFTGDIAFSMNNFKLVMKKTGYSYYNDQMEMVTDTMSDYKPEMDWLYVMKINKQDKFDKVMAVATKTGVLLPGTGGAYTVAGDSAMSIVVKDKYLVVANKAAASSAYMSGANKNQKLHEVAEKHVYEHPMSVFFDAKKLFAAVGPETMDNEKEAATFAEVKKVFDNAILSGGEYKEDAFKYELSINFNNKDENSLLQLIQMANAISEIENKKPQVAVR